MKSKQFLVAFFFGILALAFSNCAQTPAKTQDKNQTIPAELKASEIFIKFVGKKNIVAYKVVGLPKTDFALVYVAVPKDNPLGTDPAEINSAKIFIFDTKSKKADIEKTEKINLDLKSNSDDASQCGGLASLDLNSFVGNQDFVHLDQFFAPGMERTTCVSKIYWDDKKKEIVVHRIETVTE